MIRIFAMLSALLFTAPAYAEVTCHFYSYKCLPELNMLEVELHKINNLSVCQRIHADKSFRESLAEKNYITASSRIYEKNIDGKIWVLNSMEPYIQYPVQSCKIHAQENIEVSITPYPQNENANGRCGAGDNDIKVSLKQGDNIVFRGYMIDDCHSESELETVRYSVDVIGNKINRSLDTWGIDSTGARFHKHEFLNLE